MTRTSVLRCLLLFLLGIVEFTAAFCVSEQSLVAGPNVRHPSALSIRTSGASIQSKPQYRLKMAPEEDSLSKTDDSDSETPLNKIILWIGSTTSIVVAGTFFAFLAIKRDALMVSFFIGAISNGILSKVLKRLLNQERPAEISQVVKEKPSDKGMPSSHAMSLGFIGTFTALTVPQMQIPILIYVAMSLYYRIHTQLHTKEQVAVGLAVGAMNGALWRSLCSGTNPLVPSINVMEWVSNTFLNDQGLLPIPLLVVPALVGLVVVGSFERRISKWIKSD